MLKNSLAVFIGFYPLLGSPKNPNRHKPAIVFQTTMYFAEHCCLLHYTHLCVRV